MSKAGFERMRVLGRLVRQFLLAAGLSVIALSARAAPSLTATYVPSPAASIQLDFAIDHPIASVAVLDFFLGSFSPELRLARVDAFFTADDAYGSPDFPGYYFDPPGSTLDGLLLRWTFDAPAAAGQSFAFQARGLATLWNDSEVDLRPLGATVTLPTAIPEPPTWALLAGGLALLGGASRRRRPTAG